MQEMNYRLRLGWRHNDFRWLMTTVQRFAADVLNCAHQA